MLWGEGFGVFPEGAGNHLCGIAASMEDSSQVLALLGQSGGKKDPKPPLPEAQDQPTLHPKHSIN